jgi:hypothetical protein
MKAKLFALALVTLALFAVGYMVFSAAKNAVNSRPAIENIE